VIVRDFIIAFAHFKNVKSMTSGVWAFMLCGVFVACRLSASIGVLVRLFITKFLSAKHQANHKQTENTKDDQPKGKSAYDHHQQPKQFAMPSGRLVSWLMRFKISDFKEIHSVISYQQTWPPRWNQALTLSFHFPGNVLTKIIA